MKSNKTNHIGYFLAVLAVLLIIANSLAGSFGKWFFYILMLLPGLAALPFMIGKSNKRTENQSPDSQKGSLLLSLLLPVIIFIVLFLPGWALGLIDFSGIQFAENVYQLIPVFGDTQSLGISILAMLAIGTLAIGFLTFIEEMGWSGFLVPQLQKRFSVVQTGLLSGLIWFLFQLPVFIILCSGQAAASFGNLIWVSISYLGFSTIRSVLISRQGNMWSGVLLRFSHNFLLLGFFRPMIVLSGSSAFFFSECGAGMALLYGIAAVSVVFTSQKAHQALKQNVVEFKT